jgi:hypothetical protein
VAELGNQPPKGIAPEVVARWIELALYLADRILRLFGRRATDRPEREP